MIFLLDESKKKYCQLTYPIHFLGFLLLTSFFPLISCFPVVAQSQSALGAVGKVVSAFTSLGSFRTDLSIHRISEEKNREYSIQSVLSYDKGKLSLNLADGRVLATNGIYVIAYSPVRNVAAKQIVDPAVGGIGWLLNGFVYTFSSPSSVVGQAFNSTSKVKEVRLEWEKQYSLSKLSVLLRKNASWLHLRLSNTRKVTSFSTTLFSYRPPTGSRTVENALNRKN